MINQNIIHPIERWKPVTDKSVKGVRPFYWVSDLGRVYNTNINRFVPQFDDGRRGYQLITLATESGNITKSIHRIVMIEHVGFDPDPDRDEVDHKTGDKNDNSIYNLEWVSGSENITRAYDMGLMPSGEDSPVSVLRNDDVRQVCEMLQAGIDKHIILDFLRSKGITSVYSVFAAIYTRRTWKRISKDYIFQEYDIMWHMKFSESEIHIICQCLEKEMHYKDIMIALGIDLNSIDQNEINNLYQTISKIKRGETFKHISCQYNIDKNYGNIVFTENEVHYICKRLEDNNASPREILLELGYDVNYARNPKEYHRYIDSVSRIKTGKTFSHISSQYNF